MGQGEGGETGSPAEGREAGRLQRITNGYKRLQIVTSTNLRKIPNDPLKREGDPGYELIVD